MKRMIGLSVICAIALSSSLYATEDLGVISVESSTIDDKFDAKKLEVSNTVVLSGEEIEDYHATNLTEILNNIPGLTVRENEGDSNKIHIRGIATEVYMGEKPGVAIVIDGVPVQERAGSVNIDMDNIESIKIVKGGASYLYGNDALAGAVIITTKRPKAKNEGLASAETGSYGYRKYLVRYNYGTEDYALEVQGSKKFSDGYWDNSDYWAKSFNGKFQYYLDDTSDITFGVDKSTRYEDDTGSITYMTYNPDTGVYTNNVLTNPTSIGEVGYATDYDIHLDKYFLTYSKDFDNNSNLMTQIYSYEDTTENKSSAYDSDRDGLRDDHKYDSYANTKQKGFKAEYRMDGDKTASMIGIDIARNDEDKDSKYRVDYYDYYRHVLHTVGEVVSDTESKESINAIYGEIKYKVNSKLTTSLNLRLDKIDYDYTNNLTSTSWNTDFEELSYKVGATYKLKENSIIYANLSTGFRVPTLSQMYAGDMVTSTYSGTYSNNLNIDTETTKNIELGHRGKINNLTYDVAVYNLYRDDVIGKSSGNYASTRGVDVQYDNMADIKSEGLELSIHSNKNDKFSFALNYTYLDAKYTRYDEYNLILTDTTTGRDYVEGVYNLAGNTVPRTSKHTVNLELNYRPIQNLLITTELDYRSSQYADEMNQIKVEGYSVVNLRAKYNTKIGNYPVEIFAQANNIFDKQYFMMPRVTGDRNDDGLYDYRDMGLTVNEGRTYLAGLSIKF